MSTPGTITLGPFPLRVALVVAWHLLWRRTVLVKVKDIKLGVHA